MNIYSLTVYLTLNISKWILSCILGLIEGITEFLPISSTGHIVLIENLLNCTDKYMIFEFTVIVQLGAILSLLVLFWSRLYSVIINCIPNVFVKHHYYVKHFCIQHILIGSLPGVIFGTLFYNKIQLIYTPIYIVYGLIIGGIFLFFIELYLMRISSKQIYISSIHNVTILQAFLIGCFQCLAFWPGFSRSGATIGGGLLIGLNRYVASEFSFFLSIPIICGSIIFVIYNHGFYNNIMNIEILLIGCISSFIAASVTINIFLKIIQSISLIPFVIYRFLLAGSIYWGLLI